MSMPSRQNPLAGRFNGYSIEKCVKPVSGTRPCIAAMRQRNVAAPARWMFFYVRHLCDRREPAKIYGFSQKFLALRLISDITLTKCC